jgi:hypothetical protein
MLSPNLTELVRKREDLIKLNIISKSTLEFYTEERGKDKELNFEKILYLSILDNLFDSGKINFDEGKLILTFLDEYYPKFKGKNCELLFLRKLGISSCCLVSKPNEINFENSMKVVEKLNISDLIEELKIKLV